jgi:hypothetical protein
MMGNTGSTPTLYVDFNDTAPGRRVIAWRGGENAAVEVERGDVVRLRDDDGFFCDGTVQRVSKREIVVDPAWATWKRDNPLTVTKQPTTPERDLIAALREAVAMARANTASMDEKMLAEKTPAKA